LGMGALASGGWLRGASEGFPSSRNPSYSGEGLEPTDSELVTAYNNFYEFSFDKAASARLANQGWETEPWTVEVDGLVDNSFKIDVNDLIKKVGGIEQRVYRFRCVEAWSMVVPWDGFAMSKLVGLASPRSSAKYVKFYSFLDPENAPGQRSGRIDWPYVEALTLQEATNELSFLATGIFGKPMPNQNGAPIRMVVPWKYGFKSGKSIVRVEFTDERPVNTWQALQPREYGFFANVNPEVDHPRWSQASERVIGGGLFGGRKKTLMFNGYQEQVAGLYAGLNLRKVF